MGSSEGSGVLYGSERVWRVFLKDSLGILHEFFGDW